MIDIAVVSEKGQIVIPASVRKHLNIKKSDRFLVTWEGDTITLKKIDRLAVKKIFEEKPKEQVFSKEDVKKIASRIERL
jgi:AbrB family looped-hinge helix DNA binding protein